MPQSKSEFRCNLEHALRCVPGCETIADADHVFVDRSKTHDRIKFAFRKCTAKEARDIETVVDDMYPDSEVNVESTYRERNGMHHYYNGWYGVCITVSHDKGIRL